MLIISLTGPTSLVLSPSHHSNHYDLDILVAYWRLMQVLAPFLFAFVNSMNRNPGHSRKWHFSACTDSLLRSCWEAWLLVPRIVHSRPAPWLNLVGGFLLTQKLLWPLLRRSHSCYFDIQLTFNARLYSGLVQRFAGCQTGTPCSGKLTNIPNNLTYVSIMN